MAGVWKKTLQYLGLVEDEELDDLDEGMEAMPTHADPDAVRRLGRAEMSGAMDRPDAIVRTMPSVRPATVSIHRAEPKRFNEARRSEERRVGKECRSRWTREHANTNENRCV